MHQESCQGARRQYFKQDLNTFGQQQFMSVFSRSFQDHILQTHGLEYKE